VVYFVRNKEKNISLNINHFLRVYFHSIIFISVVLIVVGGALVLRALFGYAFGVQFAYDLGYNSTITPLSTSETIYPPIDIIPITCTQPQQTLTIKGKDYCFDQDQPKRDLLNGATLIVSMIFILAAHRAGLYLSEKNERSETIRRGFHLFGLCAYGLASIILIPVSLYELFDYLLFPQPDLTVYSRVIPGPLLAATVFVVPVWLIYMWLVLKERKHNQQPQD
jgi:hypothetical protein